MVVFGDVEGKWGLDVLRGRFVVSAHQQHGVDGCVRGRGGLPNSWNDYTARITLDERMERAIGSK